MEWGMGAKELFTTPHSPLPNPLEEEIYVQRS
jgi:hypothetical protein